MTIQWEDTYGGYVYNQLIPPSPITPGTFTVQANIQSMSLGDVLTVDDAGVPNITTDGTDGEIDIANGTEEWTCGIAQSVSGTLSPVCAISLNGNDFCNITPLEKVLLNFDRGELPAGTIVEEAWVKAIMIDFSLTGDETQVSVSYDIDEGWDAQSAGWSQLFTDPVSIADTLNDVVSRKPSVG
jgi:hypothetical protein